MTQVDVLVIGGGPAGLAASISARKEGARVCLIEREARLGGILKQCIHDGFGLIRFGERLSGPEYVERFMDEFYALSIPYEIQTFVTSIKRKGRKYEVTAVNRRGVMQCEANAIVLATGCRERTSKQVSIHGTRPSGIFTAGTAQHLVNLMGQMPARRCVILGSGDIGLIMARRLTLEGAEVLGVYEVKPEPSGLTRNLVQCLEDYNIPLYLSHTVTKVFGEGRLIGVMIARVDGQMRPIPGSERRIDCDTLILSVGLIPENEIGERLQVKMDGRTKGPVCSQQFMTSVDGIFSCGNSLHVNDLVDYVSESGELAGKAAAHYTGRPRKEVDIKADDSLQYVVPQELDLASEEKEIILYFRSREVMKSGKLVIRVNERTVYEKQYHNLKPPEMKRLVLNAKTLDISENSGKANTIYISIEKGEA